MTTLTKEELEKLVAVTQMVADMADGLDMAAEAEVLVIDGLDKYTALFQANDRDPKTMRALRVYNEAKSNHRRFVKESYALRTLAAKNATLQASEAAALKRIAELETALIQLRNLICEVIKNDNGNSKCEQCANDCTDCIAPASHPPACDHAA